MNLLKVLYSLSDVNTRIMKNIYTTTIQSILEYGAVTFGMMTPSNRDRLKVSQNQEVLWCKINKMMGHKLHMLPVEHRAKLNRAELYRKIRGNTKHPIHTINNQQETMKRMGYWDTVMSPTRSKTIGGTNTTTKRRHSLIGTTIIQI